MYALHACRIFSTDGKNYRYRKKISSSKGKRYISDLRLEGALRVTEVDLDEIRTFALSQISGELIPMDKLLAPHTPEAAAHYHLTENSFTWHTDQPSVDESLISGCASYRAFERYLEGNDLFLLPRTRAELESILRRYSYDAIHNAVASSRSPLQKGGYSRVCHLAEKSIRDVLNTGENANILLALHHPDVPTTNHEIEECNMTRPIATG